MALIECPECQAKISDQAENCIGCGFPLKKLNSPAAAPRPPKLLDGNPNYDRESRRDGIGLLSGNSNYVSSASKNQDYYNQDQSTRQVIKPAKSRGIYIVLGLFFGLLGVHNFYAGYFGRGIAQFLTVVILGWFTIGFVIVLLWNLAEFFMVTHDAAGDRLV